MNVIYAMVETVGKDTIRYQVDCCLNFAKEIGINIDMIYQDIGFATEAERPQYNNMLMKLDDIKTIVIKDITRIHRDRSKISEFISRVSDKGIGLLIVGEGTNIVQ